MGLVGATMKAAIGDAVLTFMWVFCASTLGALTSVIATYVGVKGMMLPSLFITTVLISVLVFVFSLIGNALGGSSFNPTVTVSFYAAGVVPHSLFSLAVRFPAQTGEDVEGEDVEGEDVDFDGKELKVNVDFDGDTSGDDDFFGDECDADFDGEEGVVVFRGGNVGLRVGFGSCHCNSSTHKIKPKLNPRTKRAAGAVGGALAIMETMPTQYKHMLGGPRLKVDVHTGAIAEGVLTFIISFAILYIFLKGPRNMLVNIWLTAMSTVTMVVVGSSFTGPAMNPANAFGWAYVNNKHNTWDQFYVYWICPFTGALLAGWVFRALFPPPEKQKKA